MTLSHLPCGSGARTSSPLFVRVRCHVERGHASSFGRSSSESRREEISQELILQLQSTMPTTTNSFATLKYSSHSQSSNWLTSDRQSHLVCTDETISTCDQNDRRLVRRRQEDRQTRRSSDVQTTTTTAYKCHRWYSDQLETFNHSSSLCNSNPPCSTLFIRSPLVASAAGVRSDAHAASFSADNDCSYTPPLVFQSSLHQNIPYPDLLRRSDRHRRREGPDAWISGRLRERSASL